MADTQQAPHPATQPIPPTGGSVEEAREALLSLMEPEEETPRAEEATPTEEEESTEEIQDESFEEESKEELEAASEEEEAEEDTEETDDGEEEDPLYAVTVNGEEHEVTFDELLRGYSRQSDYTKKTQQISSERKQMEAIHGQYSSEISQIQQERQQYVESLNQIIANASGGLDKFANVDWQTLKDSDPIEYVTKREEFRESQEKIQALQAEQQNAQHKQAEDAKRMRVQVLREEHSKLSEALPEWSKPESQKKMASEIREYALGQGFSSEEINSLVDHRSLLVLWKASKHDALQNADVRSKKLKNKPKVIRPGSPSSKSSSGKAKRTAQMKRLRGSGHLNDASALLEDFIDL